MHSGIGEHFRVSWNERMKDCCRLVTSTTYLSSGLRWSLISVGCMVAMGRPTITIVFGFSILRLFRGFGRGSIVNIALSTWFCKYGLTYVGFWISRLFERHIYLKITTLVSISTVHWAHIMAYRYIGDSHALPRGRIVNIAHRSINIDGLTPSPGRDPLALREELLSISLAVRIT